MHIAKHQIYFEEAKIAIGQTLVPMHMARERFGDETDYAARAVTGPPPQLNMRSSLDDAAAAAGWVEGHQHWACMLFSCVLLDAFIKPMDARTRREGQEGHSIPCLRRQAWSMQGAQRCEVGACGCFDTRWIMYWAAQRRCLVSENGGALVQSCKRMSVSRESGSMCHTATKVVRSLSIMCRNQ